MHRKCFLEWEHRDVFIRRYNDAVGRRIWGNGLVKHMKPDGTIVQRPAGPP